MISSPDQRPFLTVTAEGDTSSWTAEDQLAFAQAVLKLLRAVEKAMTGKNTIKWVITAMEKDD